MTKMEYLKARCDLYVIKLLLYVAPEETRQYYLQRFMTNGCKLATSNDYYESRIGFYTVKMCCDIIKYKVKKDVEKII